MMPRAIRTRLATGKTRQELSEISEEGNDFITILVQTRAAAWLGLCDYFIHPRAKRKHRSPVERSTGMIPNAGSAKSHRSALLLFFGMDSPPGFAQQA